MRTLVSAKEMRWCDETTIRKFGIPGLLLMENAGRGVSETAQSHFGPIAGRDVLIFCGKGNNGGDGFVAARHLLDAGANVTVVLMSPHQRLVGDARTNFKILERLLRSKSELLHIKSFSGTLLKTIPKPALIIDAIFGTGFSGKVSGTCSDAIEWINQQGVPVISVDVPSGVDGTTGIVENCAVEASATVTFGLLKSGLLCNQGQEHSGRVTVVDIGIPKVVRETSALKTFQIEAEDVRKVLPRRRATANKYSVGKVFVLAGSRGFTGAAYLCSMGALRAGAGAVMLGTPEAVYPILARRLSETIVRPLPSTPEGTLAGSAFDEIMEKLAWADVAVLGPGLSTNVETLNLLRKLVSNYRGDIVVDADALRVIGELSLQKLSRLKSNFVLTPHSGEYSRIIDVPAAEVDAHRIEMARSGAKKGRVTLVLKGGPTAVGTSDGVVYVNSTGNPGMATVGSGDVLTGIIASLWAQGMDAKSAAYSGVFLHGLSGDIARELFGERSIIAQDLVDQLPSALKRVEGHR